MWRTKDFDEVTFHLRRLRGQVPSGTLFEFDESGRVKELARATGGKQKSLNFWCPGLAARGR
jgi:hypothetical protein